MDITEDPDHEEIVFLKKRGLSEREINIWFERCSFLERAVL